MQGVDGSSCKTTRWHIRRTSEGACDEIQRPARGCLIAFVAPASLKRSTADAAGKSKIHGCQPAGRVSKREFQLLLETIAEGWNNKDAAMAPRALQKTPSIRLLLRQVTHELAIVRVSHGLISNWREYEIESTLPWKAFVGKDLF